MYKKIALGLIFFSSAFAAPASFQTTLNQWTSQNHLSSSVVSIENLETHQIQNFVSGPTSPQKLYGVGSISKTFVAATLLQLQEEGKVNLDDPIGPYFPQYPRWKKITLRELLNMSSGIYNFTESSDFHTLEEQHYSEKMPPQTLIHIAYQHADYFAPGQGWHYSNTNYYLAGLIIEAVTHQSLEQVYQQRFFTPLGLKHTFYSGTFYPPKVEKQMASAIPNGPGTENARTHFNGGFFGPAGSMVMNSQDLLVWTQALFTPGKVLSASSLKQLETTIVCPYTSPRPKDAAYGLGVFSMHTEKGMIWWYTGVIDGYTSFFAWIP